ncbi:MAG: biotin/lipoyl-binding protein [Planctomycetota bacterium]|nr:biotin/lipoyl-binding protein [Planctomycetota bacterium]
MEQVVAAAADAGGPLAINSPIPGLIKSVKVKAGDDVAEGQTVVVLEAMKMENEIPAPRAGTVQSVDVQPGQTVAAGLLLVTLAPLA